MAGLYACHEPGVAGPPASLQSADPAAGPSAFGDAVKTFASATATTGEEAPRASDGASAPAAGALSMEDAVAGLQVRLAKGGGTRDDWELLAKSFEFLGRPADAARARAGQLPSRQRGSRE